MMLHNTESLSTGDVIPEDRINMMLHNTESLSTGDVIVEEPDQHDVT